MRRKKTVQGCNVRIVVGGPIKDGEKWEIGKKGITNGEEKGTYCQHLKRRGGTHPMDKMKKRKSNGIQLRKSMT